MWEHGPTMEYLKFLSACENTPRKQDKSLVASDSSKTWTCSWILFFRALPRCSGYIGVNLDYLDYLLNLGYLLKLAIITCLYTSLENILTM